MSSQMKFCYHPMLFVWFATFGFSHSKKAKPHYLVPSQASCDVFCCCHLRRGLKDKFVHSFCKGIMVGL